MDDIVDRLKGEQILQQEECGRGLQVLDDAVNEIMRLRELITTHEKDTARIDFLEQTHEGVYTIVHEELRLTTDGTDRRDRILVFDGWGCGMFPADDYETAREAIDAVMHSRIDV